MTEKFYILGKLGDDDGFQVYDLKSKTTAQGDDYSFLDTSFHKDGYKELFKISRKGYKTYYTYIKNDLSANRSGCMLGLSYVYEDNSNVIKDFLGLRQKMKEALNHLLKNGKIRITSFNDNSVNASLKHIEDFTKKVNAEILPLPSNPTQFPTQNPNDLTNEKIWEMLKKSVNVEITEEIPTALSQKEQTIKTLTSQIQKLGISIQQKDTEISKLKNEKDTLIKKNEELETQLTNANSNNSVRDRKIRNALKEIENCLSSNAENITSTPHTQKQNMFKKILPFFILILVIIDIVIGVSNCYGNSKQDETKHKDEIEELKKERDGLKTNVEKLTLENSDLIDENNKLRTQLENPKKEEPAINDKDKKDKAKKEQKDTNKKQLSQDEKDYDEWKKNDNNRKAMTEKLKEYAEKNKKKYEDVNKDCKDCKEITPQEKIGLWKKHFKK